MRKLLVALVLIATIARADEPPETVIVTVKAKPGHEAQMEAVMKKHWAVIKRLDLVTGDPHTLYRSERTFIDIFTWKSASIPDNAPAEVLAVWKEMNENAEKLDILEVHKVSLE
jgi:hypothetical protein